MQSNKQIERLAKQNGIKYFGVADLSLAADEIKRQGGTEIGKYPYAISLGIALLNNVVDQLPQRPKREVVVNYRHHAYDVVNQRLDLTASLIGSFIQDNGYNVLPIPSSQQVDEQRICAEFSHKLAARLSGLGWIGKSCLLITPENGPRVRWVSVLTDLPLKPTGRPLEVRCADCSKCVDICPVDAFTGKLFNEEEAREVRYDAKKCKKYFEQMKKAGQLSVCGMCLYICPHGRNDNLMLAR